jgi:uracil-DNA glycosylase family 4
MTKTLGTERRFFDLVQKVNNCRKCSRMEGSARVLGPGCGPLDARLMFVGEAPGRLGADGSHLPFHGDKSGHNFESLISQVGISRYQVFVTNAVLCNPKDENGNNATPTKLEIGNCAPHFRELLDVLNPPVVVTLGAVALKACEIIEPHDLTLKASVRTSNKWRGRSLIPLYHPGQRAMVHRSFANQLSDYQFVSETFRRITQPTRRRQVRAIDAAASKLGLVAGRVIRSQSRGLSYFALHKLCFLAEVAVLEATGQRLTNSYVVRQKDGPYFVDLHAAKLSQLVPDALFNVGYRKLTVKSTSVLDLFSELDDDIKLTHREKELIDAVLGKYGGMSDADLKRVVYLNKYMRVLLRKEKNLGLNLFNAAILPSAQ